MAASHEALASPAQSPWRVCVGRLASVVPGRGEGAWGAARPLAASGRRALGPRTHCPVHGAARAGPGPGPGSISGSVCPQARYRKEQTLLKHPPCIPLVENLLKDGSDGCALAALIHFYCPGVVRLEGERPGRPQVSVCESATRRPRRVCSRRVASCEVGVGCVLPELSPSHRLALSLFEDICLKETMSLADSLYNLQLIQEFCQEYLNQCCHFTLEDMLYAASSIKVQ